MQHFSKATVSATEWCSKCRAMTVHKVQLGRLGACEECLARLDDAKLAREEKPAEDPPAVQESLWD